jgi:hypothetical protein
MRFSRRLTHGWNLLWRRGLDARRAYVLVACLSLAALFVLASHPLLHPLEVINPDTNGHHACPLSHVAAALVTALLWLLGAGLALARLADPFPWFGHSYFIHPLAPRPPPASLL